MWTTEMAQGKKLYVIEKILKRRVRNGKDECLIKWKGYTSEFNTWEPYRSIVYLSNAKITRTRKQPKAVEKTPLKRFTDLYFVIDKILDKRVTKNKVECLIKWKGYGKKFHSWEPERSIVDLCKLPKSKIGNIRKKSETAKKAPKTAKEAQTTAKQAPKTTSRTTEICGSFSGVEKILARRIVGTKTEYLIQWKRFHQDENTWEQSDFVEMITKKQFSYSGPPIV